MVRASTTVFPERRRERNPSVIVRVQSDTHHDRHSYERAAVKGEFYRVVPQTAREIAILQLIDHRVDKFAPAEGNGALVRVEALEKFSH